MVLSMYDNGINERTIRYSEYLKGKMNEIDFGVSSYKSHLPGVSCSSWV